MCGIAGIVDYRSSSSAINLQPMADALAHRGPDGQGLQQVHNVGLVHTRLSIIDLAGGRQPLSDRSDTLHLVANGEIYNYLELKEIYATNSAANISLPKTASDSEQIISAYQAEGVEGFQALHGMFAFALYDAGRKRLLLARDRLGIKPLYYCYDNGRFLFASEIKALLAAMKKAPAIEAGPLSQFLQNQFSTGRNTVFEGIYRVLPGEYVDIDTTTYAIKHTQYWSALNQPSARQHTTGMDEASQQFGSLFEQVMHEHMRADVPFGLFLSGGIDSSLLLAAIQRWRDAPEGDRLRTYSIGYQGEHLADELSEAERIAKHFGTEHVSLSVSRDDLFNRIVHSIWCVDDLMRDFACLPTALLSERAAADVKVVFSGEGGDEAFAGYRRYAASFDNWLKSIMKGSGGFRTRGQWESPVPSRALTSKLPAGAARAPMRELWAATPTSWSAMQRRQAVDIVSALPDNLFVKADRIMMGYGLEGRVPFADHRMIEFGLTLPDKVKMRGTQGKQLLRHWGRQELPASIAEELFSRPKKGFYVPVNAWLTGDFLDQLEQKILINRHVGEWFDREGLRGLFQAQREKPRYARHIWCVMQFAIWAKLFIDNPGRVPGKIEHPLDWL